MKKRLIGILLVLVLGFHAVLMPEAETVSEYNGITYSNDGYVRVPLNRGINFTCLEMEEYRPEEYILEAGYYRTVKARGFDHIRLPVNFSLYCDANNRISEDIFEKTDKAIKNALDAGLYAVLDMHGCGDINSNSTAETEKLYSLWEQVSRHYRDYDERLIFELLNEPNTGATGAPDPLDSDKLNEIQNGLITLIRDTNPKRVLIAAAADNNTVWNLKKLSLPEEDKNIITTVHIYNPMEFTHQGASWMSSGGYPKCGWKSEFAESIADTVKIAADYQKSSGRQVWVGEFGVCLNVADEEDVRKYITAARSLFEANGLGWCYWEFWMSFGAFDRNNGVWKEYVVDSLIPMTGQRIDTAFAKESDVYPREDAVSSYAVIYGKAGYNGDEQNAAKFTLTEHGMSSGKNISFTTRNSANNWKTWNFNDYPNAVLRMWLKTEKAMNIGISVQETDTWKSFGVNFSVTFEQVGEWTAFDIPVSYFFTRGMTGRFNVMFINPSGLELGESIYIGNLEYWSAAPPQARYPYSEPLYSYTNYSPYDDENYTCEDGKATVLGGNIPVKYFTATKSGADDFSGQMLSNSIIKYELYADSSLFSEYPNGFFMLYIKIPHDLSLRIAVEESGYAQKILYDKFHIDYSDGYIKLKIPVSILEEYEGRLLYFYIGRAYGATPENGLWLAEKETLSLSALCFYANANNFIYDVNSDCVLDIRDLIRVKKFMAVLRPGGDVNRDGAVDSRDAILIRRRLLANNV